MKKLNFKNERKNTVNVYFGVKGSGKSYQIEKKLNEKKLKGEKVNFYIKSMISLDININKKEELDEFIFWFKNLKKKEFIFYFYFLK